MLSNQNHIIQKMHASNVGAHLTGNPNVKPSVLSALYTSDNANYSGSGNTGMTNSYARTSMRLPHQSRKISQTNANCSAMATSGSGVRSV